MKHLPSVVKPEERRVIAFQGSHLKGHPAHKGLEAGIDALIAAGKQVKVTAHSEHGDANSILQTEGLGEKELRQLIACAGSAALSSEGKVAELSKLPETEYMKARQDARGTCRLPRSRSCQAPAETVEGRSPICLERCRLPGSGAWSPIRLTGTPSGERLPRCPMSRCCCGRTS
jgi:hypothetical protein